MYTRVYSSIHVGIQLCTHVYTHASSVGSVRLAYLCWDIDTSIFGVCSLTTLPSHYGDFMRQPRRVRAGRSRCDGSNRCNRANRVGEGVHVLGAVSVGLGGLLDDLALALW